MTTVKMLINACTTLAEITALITLVNSMDTEDATELAILCTEKMLEIITNNNK